jgi:hypothetical protein
MSSSGQESAPRSYVLTIDVEVDAGRKWRTTDPATYLGVTQGIERLQASCERHGVRPVYLISPAVMVDANSIAFLKSLDTTKCELGAHLHGEYIGPQAKYPGPDFSGCDPSEMQCHYDRDLEFAKLQSLTNRFVELFGYAPKSFRAGRFGARGWTLECLEKLGYSHDSSVTPFRNWYDQVDFSNPCSVTPYYPSKENICEFGDAKVLEVPVSITPELKWLRPTPRFSDFDGCVEVIQWYEEHAAPTVLCSMFHNVELVPGMSPYCKTQADCDAMVETIERTFDLLKARNYSFKTLSEVTTAG